jgi:hypothetical protein
MFRRFVPGSAAAAATALLALAPSASEARAEDCVYPDLQAQFTVSADCAGLQDHSGIGQEQKRLWLAGPWGELQIMEVPAPYRDAPLDEVMGSIGRFWTVAHTPQPPEKTTVSGIDARVTTERKLRTTSRSWLFLFGGRNLVVRAVAYGKRAEREQRLEQISQAFLDGFRPNASGEATPAPEAAAPAPEAAAPPAK